MPAKSPRVAEGWLGLCTAGCPCASAAISALHTVCVLCSATRDTGARCVSAGDGSARINARDARVKPATGTTAPSVPPARTKDTEPRPRQETPRRQTVTFASCRQTASPARTATGENKLGGAGGKFFNSLGKPHTHLPAPPHRRRDSLPGAGDPRDPPPAPPRSAPRPSALPAGHGAPSAPPNRINPRDNAPSNRPSCSLRARPPAAGKGEAGEGRGRKSKLLFRSVKRNGWEAVGSPGMDTGLPKGRGGGESAPSSPPEASAPRFPCKSIAACL